MKTGRRRKKEPSPEAPQPVPSAPPEGAPPSKAARPPIEEREPSPARARARPATVWLAILIALVVLACVGLLLARACMGPSAPSTTYLPATAEGSWRTTVRLVVPQVTVREGWRSDCEADAQCTVLPGTCEVREREDSYTERVVDEYDDYAYSIYYEEIESKLYEAIGDRFAVTQLNANRDWWEGDRHYFSEEWLDTETCQYTAYTVWITDPEDADYEIEVVLSECEVWDHVVVKERVYGEQEYCQTENVDSLAVRDTLTRQGVGAGVEWQDTIAPADGRLERGFEGTVVFRADGAQRTVQVTDSDTYVRYLTVPHYLGVDDQGNVVDLTDREP